MNENRVTETKSVKNDNFKKQSKTKSIYEIKMKLNCSFKGQNQSIGLIFIYIF